MTAFWPPPELPTTPSCHAPTTLELFKRFPFAIPIPIGLSGEDLNQVAPSKSIEFVLEEVPAILIASEEIANTSALEVAPGKSANV